MNIKAHSGKGVKGNQEEDKGPYQVPESWKWRSVADVAELVTDGEHATPARITERQVPLVSAKNVRDGVIDYANTDWVSFDTAEKAWRRCRPATGDILLVCVGATTGRLSILREAKDMVLVRSVALIRPSVGMHADYLAVVLRSPMCQDEIWRQIKVTAQPCLYINRIKLLPIPLPPLAEQHHIVAKVDELMALCDQLEAAKTEREESRDRLVAASLHRLNSPADTAETDAPDLPPGRQTPSATTPTSYSITCRSLLPAQITSSNCAKPSSTSPYAANSSPKIPTTNRRRSC